MNDEAIGKFAQDLRGPVIGRNHPKYEEARKLYIPDPTPSITPNNPVWVDLTRSPRRRRMTALCAFETLAATRIDVNRT
jgi:hypothetical protein